MKKSILYNLWSTANNTQLNRFEKFIKSPYLNPNLTVITLFKIFKREFNKGIDACLDNKTIFSELYPKQAFNNQKLRLLYSDTFKIYKSFLSLEENPFYKTDNLYLAQHFNTSEKQNLYQRSLIKLEKNLEKQNVRNANYFLQKYSIAKEKYDSLTTKKRLKVVPFNKIMSSFDLYYYIEKLRQGCILIADKNTALNNISEPNLFFVLQSVDSAPSMLNQHPTLAIYYFCFKALSNIEVDTYYQNFRKLLFENIDLFEKNESRELLIMGINYCAKRINDLELKYINEVFLIYKLGFEKNILIGNNSISPFTFKNALTVAIEIGDIDWAENFLNTYADYLPASQKDSVQKYGHAKILISKGEITKAKRLLAQFHSDDILLNLSSKMLLIQLYIEEKQFELLANLLDNMNVYINRKKNMPYQKKHYKEVIKFTKKIMNLPPFDQSARKKLKREIENSDVKLMKKSWFLEQVSS